MTLKIKPEEGVTGQPKSQASPPAFGDDEPQKGTRIRGKQARSSCQSYREQGLRKWGTETQGTHSREGETGHNVPLEGMTGGTQKSETVSTKLQRIAELADNPEIIFKSIAHLMDIDFIEEAYRLTRKDGVPGLSGKTAKEYAANLHENLHDLHQRLKNKTYKAPPVKRAWVEKEDGSKRAIAIAEFEDKVAQRAVVMLLTVIYEQVFYPFSYGSRKGKSPHQAIEQLRQKCIETGTNWIVDADVCGFFDNLNKSKLREMIQQRVKDGAILKLIGKWLNAGVVDGNSLSYPEKGTPQGGVVSPMLANIYMHYVLDEWFVKELQPQLQGHCFIIRFVDDFIIGCELEQDARRVMEALKSRFAQFDLTIHPEKSAVIEFRNPSNGSNSGSGTFDFLGFTHYWAKSRQGYWVIKRKTAEKKLKRTRKRIWQWCRNNRHKPIKEQHQKICQKLRGHFQYFAIRCNYKALEKVQKFARKAWHYWLNRRSSKNLTWEKFEEILATFPLPNPRIIHNI